ncbi:PREDICTED: non-syndromic hearing impairment protein 5 [Condylura cristata]|uniref:non-syndromic hearing impairment protein 5 n=1 Tax=Condylura cristata TaxID=143302 RepID=UPI0006429ADB|nr:PREDICTED: non-syndromic hearing impairment protein 5 [Condylura cristata]
MFAKATRNFLREVDSGGNLIAVSNLNDSDRLQLLSLVTKKRRFWFWQRPKYQFLSVTLGDVLIEDQSLNPGQHPADDGCALTGLERELDLPSLSVVEREKHLWLGTAGHLSKSAPRKINMKNPILQQVLESRNEVLCILTQKIVTTQKCVISEHMQIEEKCGGMVGIQTKTVQVSAMEDGNVIKDTNVVLEIPAATAIAYGVIELHVKLDGQFEFCLLQGKHGGFEQERSVCVFMERLPFRELEYHDMPDGGQRPLSIFKQATPLLERNFHPFVELPEQQQTALSDVLQAVLLDAELLVVLDQVCDDVVFGLSPPQEMLGELKSPQQQDLMAFLRLVGYRMQGQCLGPQDVVSNQKLFFLAYFLVSALAEMPDDAALLLGTCCKLQIIPTLCYLLHALSDDGEADLEDPALAPLKDTERFGITQRLFASADMSLERLQSSVKAAVQKDPHLSPLMLYISLSGLCALDRGH